MSDEALQRLVEGLSIDGFRLHLKHSGPTFAGSVQVNRQTIPLRLEYSGFNFTEPPKVFVESEGGLGPGVHAHLDEAGELCVVDRREYVADRYAIAEQARGIVQRAAEVLELGLTRAGTQEIAEEFPRHWGGQLAKVRFGPTDGFAKIDETRSWTEFELCGPPESNAKAGAVVVQTSVRLSFLDGQDRPNTWPQFRDWASTWDATLFDRVLDGLVRLGPSDPIAIIYAPNGIILLQVKVSSKGAAFVATLRKASTWRSQLEGKLWSQLAIERGHGQRVDMPYILRTNGREGAAALGGRHITLVGCGAIGGFLSFALAQFGAGLQGGSLALIDSEILEHRNIARHRLGAEQIGSNKATACKASVDRAFPGLSIIGLPLDVEQCQSRVLESDLVIDATGEQPIGDLLNSWRLDQAARSSPAFSLLHVWVAGDGAAVQSYFSSEPGFGCYRCLQPDLITPSRFPVVRPGVEPIRATGCGEASFSPYGPAAPMMAAALAAEHATDWAHGEPKPLLRTVRLSYEETQERKPTNPAKSDKCPACGGR